jgi:hypothetical protein
MKKKKLFFKNIILKCIFTKNNNYFHDLHRDKPLNFMIILIKMLFTIIITISKRDTHIYIYIYGVYLS